MRYILFQFDPYAPGGGWEHFISTYERIEEAKAAVKPSTFEVYQIVDMILLEIVIEGLASEVLN